MKLHADPRSTTLSVTAYGHDYVAVGPHCLKGSFLLLPDHIEENWGPSSIAGLTVEHTAFLATLPCDVLLLGTGTRQRFPAISLLRPLVEAGRSLEVMDTPAACRTYNILVAEGRSVAAALIIEMNN